MNVSIGNMSTQVLGVAKSNSAAAAEYYPPPDPLTVGTSAEGVAAIPTKLKLDFLNTSAEDSYTFKLTDSISNISKTIDNFSVDLTNQFSKDSFADKINLALRSAQTDTTVTGSTQMTSSSTNKIDITDSSKFSNTQFSISLDAGPDVKIDIRQRLSSTAGVETTSVTQTNIINALQNELQRLFDERITVGTAAGSLTINDEEGRRIKVSQGIGNGFLFGTDAVNCGPLIQRETSRNNLFVEWEDDSLIVTNKAGGKTLLENYQASADSQILLRIENEGQIDGFYDPVLLATVSTTNLPTMPSATFTGITEESQMSIRFSDQVGDYSSAEYSFKITNGEGDIYADFSGSGLNVFNTVSEVPKSIVMAVEL